jgi:hypothetical protein
METGTFFHRVRQMIMDNAIESANFGRRAISLHRLRMIYKQTTGSWPLKLLALQEAVEKGVRNGYWEMEYDENADADIIVLLERKESSAPRATVEKRPHI